MRKIIVLCLLAMLTIPVGHVFAALNDTPATMAAQYGDFRLVSDVDGQLWTKAEWETTGHLKTAANLYIYYFNRSGQQMQMDVRYENDSPNAFVKMQRITPSDSVKIREFKDFFPELYQLLIKPSAQIFTTTADLTRNFLDSRSPVVLGALINEQAAPGRPGYITLMAFNVKDEGRLIRNPKYVTPDCYISEFTVERVSKEQDDDPNKILLKNPFI